MTRLLIVVFAAVIGTLLGTGPAAAHSVAASSDPADGAQVDTGPARASVTFNEALQDSFAALTVTGPDGNIWSKGDPTVQGPTVSVDVGELGPVGTYTLAYRVTSADGHPVSGTRTFTLTKPGTGSPVQQQQNSSESDSGIPIWPFVVAAVVLFAGGLVFALRKPKNV